MLKVNQYTVIDTDMTYDTLTLVQKQLDLMLDDESIDQNIQLNLSSRI